MRVLFVAAEPQRLFNDLRARPELLQQLGRRDPGLVRAVESNDISMMKVFPMINSIVMIDSFQMCLWTI